MTETPSDDAEAVNTAEIEEESAAQSDEKKPSRVFDSLFSGFEIERAEHDKRYADLAASPNYARSLSKAAADYMAEPEQFNPGDLVTWKASLRNRRFPAYGRPAVVIEVVPGRTISSDEAKGIPEPIDLTLGILDGDGDFMVYHYEGRRFTEWKASVAD